MKILDKIIEDTKVEEFSLKRKPKIIYKRGDFIKHLNDHTVYRVLDTITNDYKYNPLLLDVLKQEKTVLPLADVIDEKQFILKPYFDENDFLLQNNVKKVY